MKRQMRNGRMSLTGKTPFGRITIGSSGRITTTQFGVTRWHNSSSKSCTKKLTNRWTQERTNAVLPSTVYEPSDTVDLMLVAGAKGPRRRMEVLSTDPRGGPLLCYATATRPAIGSPSPRRWT